MPDTPDQVEDVFLSFLGDNPKSPKQVRTQMTKKIASDPESAKAYAARAWALMELDENDEAIADATRAIELCPEAYLPWYIRGTCYWRTEKNELAEADLTEAIRLAKSVRLWLEEMYRNRGGLRCNAGRYDEAIADLTKCVKHDPDNSYGYAFRGNAYCGKKKYAQALKDYEKALSYDKYDSYVLGLLAWFLATCPDEKFRDGKRALKLAKTANQMSDDEELDKLAAAYAETGDFKNALKTHKQAIKKNTNPSDANRLNAALASYEAEQPYHRLWEDE